MNLPVGHKLQNAKYQLTKVIGQGGFGITYLGVWNTEVKGNLGTVKTDVPVCIKEYFFKDYCYRDENTSHVLVHSETGRQLFDKFKEKLIKEAKILSEVHHPYIVNVLEVFEENNTAYIAMEFISGCSLKYMLDVEGVLSEKKVLRYIAQIAQALDFVHQKNILHLDIKPSNILIDKKDNARLIDFGVSKRYDIEQQETSTTMLTLSKGFAPIEQYDNEGTQSFSPCPDIYSLGATMYNLLTGEIPTESILRATKPLVKPSENNSEVSPQTEAVILTAMQVNPIHRYQTVQAMINELDIPSYFEEASNLLIEGAEDQTNHDEDEGTELLTDSKIPPVVDDELTQLRQSEEQNGIIRKRKRKRRVIIPVLIFVFAFLAGGIAYMVDNNKTKQVVDQTTEILSPGLTEEPETTSDPVTNDNSERENQGNTTGNPPPVESARPQETRNPDTGTSQENQNELPDEQEDIHAAAMKIEEYNELLAAGKSKLSQNDYADAKSDIEKAKIIAETTGLDLSEVNSLLTDIYEQEKVERLAQYDKKSSLVLGDLTVTQLLENKLWGAIDASGNVIIDFKYRGTGMRTDGTREFILNDNQVDIYDKTGKFLRSEKP